MADNEGRSSFRVYPIRPTESAFAADDVRPILWWDADVKGWRVYYLTHPGNVKSEVVGGSQDDVVGILDVARAHVLLGCRLAAWIDGKLS